MKTFLSKQSGAALVVTSVLLAVSMVVGLTSMNVSRQEERMAGNQRASVAALMAAEAGLANAQRIIADKIGNNEQVVMCSDGWEEIADWRSGQLAGQQQVGYSLSACVSDTDKYFLRSEGVVFAIENGEEVSYVSRRVSAEAFTFSGFLGFSTIMSLGGFCPPDGTFWAGGGSLTVTGRETVDGGFNDAVAVPEGNHHGISQYLYTLQSIENTKGNVKYNGGVSDGISESLLRDPSAFYEFIFGGDVDAGGSLGIYNEDGAVFNPSNGSYGSVENPQITIIEGNFSDTGNFSGAGVMVIEGDVKFKGTPRYDGLIIVLGDYSIGSPGPGGGGGGSTTKSGVHGSVVSSPFLTFDKFLSENQDEGTLLYNEEDELVGLAVELDGITYVFEPNDRGYVAISSPDEFSTNGRAAFYDCSTISLGQGNAEYKYDVDMLKMAESLLSDELSEWLNESNISDNSIEGLVIDRWREIVSYLEGVEW